MSYELIIRGGTVIDGTGAPRRKADVAVSHGKVARIAPDIRQDAGTVICAEGKIVSPGFIDAHSHTDCSILLGRDGYSKLEQGVTTEITGECGDSAAPCYPGSTDGLKDVLSPDELADYQRKCRSFSSFMAAVKQQPMGVNMAFYAGQGNIRGAVMGYRPDAPTAEETRRLCALTREAMEAGFLGFSTGLVYTPSVYAGSDELIAMAQVVGEYGGVYTSHIRGEGAQLLDSMEEAIRIGEAAGIPVVISHIKVIGKQNQGDSAKAIDLLERANARGVQVRADLYPYLGGSSGLLSQLPPRFLTQGRGALLARLGDPDLQKELERAIFQESDVFESSIYTGGYENCVIAEAPGAPQYIGKNLVEIGEALGLSPMAACCRVLTDTHGEAQGIYFNQNEEDMLALLRHPYVCAGSDWSCYAQHFDPQTRGGAHPRGTATMVRRLELIRDKGLMSLEEAIHGMTQRAALSNGLTDVGVLAEGMPADLCVFDYPALKANATYAQPFLRNEGIDTVLVGGGVAVRDGVFTGLQNGRVLRRD